MTKTTFLLLMVTCPACILWGCGGRVAEVPGATGGAGGADAGEVPAGRCTTAPHGRWLPTPLEGVPVAAMDPSIRWTGKEMLVLPPTNNGGAFLDPCALRWRKAADAGASSGQPLTDSDSGLLYFSYNWSTRSLFSSFDPRRNLWRALELPGKPDVSWVLNPFAVGDRGLLLWGARPQFSHSWSIEDVRNPNGFWYDLAANRWRDTRSQGALAGRLAPATVWTGKKLFIWGGKLPTDAPLGADRADGVFCPSANWLDQCRFGDGALYDPATDVWTRINPVGAPGPRSGQVAVWTGKRVVLWGGDSYAVKDQLVGHPEGFLFDPETNTWSGPITPPPPREQVPPLEAVPAELIPRMLKLNDIFYDPDRDRWRAIPNFTGQRTPHFDNGDPVPCGWSQLQSNAMLYDCTNTKHEGDYLVYSLTSAQWTVIPAWKDAPSQIGSWTWTGSQLILWGGWRYGPTPSNPCVNVPPGVGCDPPGPERVPVNEGAVFTP